MVNTMSNRSRVVSPTPVALDMELTVWDNDVKGVGKIKEGEKH